VIVVITEDGSARTEGSGQAIGAGALPAGRLILNEPAHRQFWSRCGRRAESQPQSSNTANAAGCVLAFDCRPWFGAPMNHEMTSSATTPLPPPPKGWFDYAYAVLWNGDLALVRSDRDIHTEFGHWRHRAPRGDVGARQPSLWGGRLRLTTFDGSGESGAIEVPAGHGPKVGRLPDGRWLVTSSRAAPSEKNAHLYTADGAPAGTFAMGDGIEHIQCAADGTIWVGYFDEGVFSGPMEDGSWPISSSGIARFGPDGRVLWKFNDQKCGGFHRRLLCFNA